MQMKQQFTAAIFLRQLALYLNGDASFCHELHAYFPDMFQEPVQSFSPQQVEGREIYIQCNCTVCHE